eukprot:GHVT01060602.1.p1 GENE.GHVT01060602.1~~GHVT01060602.1.p1  ORF type:complete len:396 (+),score=47.66 GHVT01060602.1:830-2017(+)
MAWPDSSSIEQGWEDSVVASAPFSAQVCESSLSNPTTETGVHAMESGQDAGGPDGGPKFSTSRGKSKGAKTPSQRPTVKDSTPQAKQGGQKKKRLIGALVAGIATALITVAGIATVAILYKSSSADTEAQGLQPSSSLSGPSPKSVELASKYPHRPELTNSQTEDIQERIEKIMEWTPEAIQARKEECADEVARAPHKEVFLEGGVRVREQTRLHSQPIRARQQEELIFDAINWRNPCLPTIYGLHLAYYDSYIHLKNLLGDDDSLRKLRFMTLNKLRLFGLNCHHDFPELLKTFNAVDKTPSNYDLDHEREIHVLPYVTELREALKNTKNADQLARQIIHIISNKTMPPKNAHTVETFTTLKNWLEDWNIEMLKRDVYELPANEEEYQKLKASK